MIRFERNMTSADSHSGGNQEAGAAQRNRATLTTVKEALLRFMVELDASEVEQLWRNGSIWIRTMDWKVNEVDSKSFFLRGNIQSGITHQSTLGLSLIVDMAGTAEVGLLETEIDEADPDDKINTDELGQRTVRGGYALFTTEQARAMMIDASKLDIESNFGDLAINFGREV